MLHSVDRRTCSALNDLVATVKSGVFACDADGTIWKRDSGEGFFVWMMKNHYYPAERMPLLEEKWAHYEKHKHDPGFDGSAMYELMVTSMAGLKEQDVARLARRYFDSEHKDSIYQPMAALISALRETGFTPWIVSGSPYWVVAAGARHFGIQADHVIGLRVKVDAQGRLTDQIERPVPWKEGKAQRLLERAGRPVIAAGNSQGDLWMLKAASDLTLAINPERDLASYARAQTWHVNKFSTSDTLGRWQRASGARVLVGNKFSPMTTR